MRLGTPAHSPTQKQHPCHRSELHRPCTGAAFKDRAHSRKRALIPAMLPNATVVVFEAIALGTRLPIGAKVLLLEDQELLEADLPVLVGVRIPPELPDPRGGQPELRRHLCTLVDEIVKLFRVDCPAAVRVKFVKVLLVLLDAVDVHTVLPGQLPQLLLLIVQIDLLGEAVVGKPECKVVEVEPATPVDICIEERRINQVVVQLRPALVGKLAEHFDKLLPGHPPICDDAATSHVPELLEEVRGLLRGGHGEVHPLRGPADVGDLVHALPRAGGGRAGSLLRSAGRAGLLGRAGGANSLLRRPPVGLQRHISGGRRRLGRRRRAEARGRRARLLQGPGLGRPLGAGHGEEAQGLRGAAAGRARGPAEDL
mmetsp:Transcript_43914/g.126975  ORF Transcript_43914/g.126975 Transcript_43914/m.126975 type:complete len:369 (-) Transcript_43914:215-1321(-)